MSLRESLIVAVFAASAAAQITERVSLLPSGTAPITGSTFGTDVSDNGALVVFSALDLTNTVGLYVRSIPTNTTAQLLSNAVPLYPSISGSGGVATFHTYVGLLPSDTNGTADVYLMSTLGGSLELVSLRNGGGLANGPCIAARVSDDGNLVVFHSSASNLVITAPPILLGLENVYARNRALGTTVLCSAAPGGGGGSDGHSTFADVSGNGQYVVFETGATNLVVPDANGTYMDILVFDLATGLLARVNVDSAGAQANLGNSRNPSISQTGRFIAFESSALNFGGPVGGTAIYVHDRDPDADGNFTNTLGVTRRVSVTATGAPAVGAFTCPRISDDGGRVAYLGNSAGIFPNPPFFNTVHLVDLVPAPAIRVRDTHVDSFGNAANSQAGGGGGNEQYHLGIAGDGVEVVFTSYATNLDVLVPDTNGQPDVYATLTCVNPTRNLGLSLAGTGALHPEFSICEDPFGFGLLEWRVRRGNPNALSVLVASFSFNPTPLLGGLLAPLPIDIGTAVMSLDGGGSVSFLLPVAGPMVFYGQWLSLDPGAVQGVSFSNCLEVTRN